MPETEKLSGTVCWWREDGYERQGPANGTLNEDGRLVFSILDGGNRYGVEIEVNDRGQWISLDDGSKGLVTGSLSRTQTGCEVNGKWWEEEACYSWQMTLTRVEVLPNDA